MDVEIQGTSYSARTAREGSGHSGWTIEVGGQSWLADVVPVGDSWSVLLRAPGKPGTPAISRSLTVAFDRLPDDTVRARIDGRDVLISLGGGAARPAAGRRAGAAAGVQTLKAPMPGRVVKVLVARGDIVADRQPVVVLEAMKMQNDVRAVRGGRVGEVHVVEGTLVEAASPLVTVMVGDDGQS